MKPMPQEKNLYEILAVGQNASEDEIKKSFRQMARKYHPDNKETGDEEKFKELSQAYEILSDPQKRSAYDTYGTRSFSSQGVDFGFNDLSDLFSEFFGGRSARRSYSGPERGSDLRYDLEIDFLEAVNGCTKNITISTLEECSTCSGSGAKPGSKSQTCPLCNGHGEVKKVTESFFGHVTQIATCHNCNGEGTVVEHKCHDCKGQGRVKVKESLEVKIPCGVDEGSRLRWQQKGEAGKKGGPRGDLYVVIFIKEHEVFKRQGLDIFLKHKISFPKSALGGKEKVLTTEGEKELNIPAGVQSGTLLKMPGLGIPKLNNLARRGDQYVEIAVTTPAKLSKEEMHLYEKLLEIENVKQKR